MLTYKLTDRQREANRLLGGSAVHNMLFGGSRSGKTFLLVRAVVARAIKCPGSRHAIMRFRFNHCKTSIVADTFPKVMETCFPEFKGRWTIDRTDWYATLPGGSEIWFGGLDDKERTEKILGQEYATIYLNECSQIPWTARKMAVTRLAQNCSLALKMYYDCNPPPQTHWTYQLFINLCDPESRQPLNNAENFANMQMNPIHNAINLPSEYIAELEGLPERDRRRFLSGEFIPANENALFSQVILDRQRIIDGDKLPDFQRIVIAVDPSGSGDEDNADNDEIGVAVAALGTDGHAYVLEDLTLKTGPAGWGGVVGSAFDRHSADMVIGENNYGGAMVKHVIQTARPGTPYKSVTATRGKVVRAEPISALYETGKVHHVGYFPDLENELLSFTTTGYAGIGSPNRADAVVWALTELFPSLTKKTHKKIDKTAGLHSSHGGSGGWLGA